MTRSLWVCRTICSLHEYESLGRTKDKIFLPLEVWGTGAPQDQSNRPALPFSKNWDS